MANDPLNPLEGNPLERNPNLQPDANNSLEGFKSKLGLSPEQTVDREQSIVRSKTNRDQDEANIKQKDAEEMQEARKKLGLPPVEGFNPDRPIEEGIQDASDKYEAKRVTVRINKAKAEEGFDVMAEGYKAADESRNIAQEQLRKTVADEKERIRKASNESTANMGINLTEGAEEDELSANYDAAVNEINAEKNTANEQFQQNISDGLEAKAQEKTMNDDGAKEASRLVQEGLDVDAKTTEDELSAGYDAAVAEKAAKDSEDQKEIDERFAGLRSTEDQKMADKESRDAEALDAHNLMQEQIATEQVQKLAEAERLDTDKKAENEEFLQSLSQKVNVRRVKEETPVLSREQIAGWNKDFNETKAAEAAKQKAQKGNGFLSRTVGRIGKFFSSGARPEQAKMAERAKQSSPELDEYLNRISGQGAVETPAEVVPSEIQATVEAPVVAEAIPVPTREVTPVAESPVEVLENPEVLESPAESAPKVEKPEEEQIYDLKEEDMIKEPEVVAEVMPEQPAEKKLVKAERLPEKEKAETEKKLSNAEKLSLLQKLKEKWDEARKVKKEIARIQKALEAGEVEVKKGKILFGKKVKTELQESLADQSKMQKKLSKEIVGIAEKLSGRNLRQEAEEYTKIEIDGEELSKDEKYKLYNDSLVEDIQDLFEDEVNKLRKAEGKEAIKSNKKPLVRATAILGSKAGNKNQLRIAPKQLPIAKALSGGALSVNLPRPRAQRVIEVPETNLQNAG